MRPPHWLRHHWTKWTHQRDGSNPMMWTGYDYRRYDQRECTTCGRRQVKPI